MYIDVISEKFQSLSIIPLGMLALFGLLHRHKGEGKPASNRDRDGVRRDNSRSSFPQTGNRLEQWPRGRVEGRGVAEACKSWGEVREHTWKAHDMKVRECTGDVTAVLPKVGGGREGRDGIMLHQEQLVYYNRVL